MVSSPWFVQIQSRRRSARLVAEEFRLQFAPTCELFLQLIANVHVTEIGFAANGTFQSLHHVLDDVFVLHLAAHGAAH